METQELERYSVITKKNPREIVLLRGSGCVWKKCTFCDYHFDASKDKDANYQLNHRELQKVIGAYQHLEVINSGSFFELDDKTLDDIYTVCQEKNIKTLHFESHWLFRKHILEYKEKYKKIGVDLKIKIGVETFDMEYRENILNKGMGEASPEEIREYFDEVCLLQGISGQTVESMKKDIETGLSYFERVCVNVMVENTTPIKPDEEVIKNFVKEVYPLYKDNDRVDILLNNTDFGVGGNKENE